MDFGKCFNDSLAIAKLDEDAIRRTAADAEATIPAIVFLAIGGVTGSIGSMNPMPLIMAPLCSAIFIGILWGIAKLFGGQGGYLDQFRPMALATSIQWIGIIPFVGPFLAAIASLWSLVVCVIIIRTTHNISTGAAIAVVVIPAVICIGIVAVAIFMVGLGVASLMALSSSM